MRRRSDSLANGSLFVLSAAASLFIAGGHQNRVIHRRAELDGRNENIERGEVVPESGKTLRDYITEYQTRAKNDQIHRFAQTFGLDEEKLRYMMSLGLTESNINEFGRLDELSRTIDKTKAKAYFEAKEGVKLIPPKVNMKMDRLLRLFIISGGFEVDIS